MKQTSDHHMLVCTPSGCGVVFGGVTQGRVSLCSAQPWAEGLNPFGVPEKAENPGESNRIKPNQTIFTESGTPSGCGLFGDWFRGFHVVQPPATVWQPVGLAEMGNIEHRTSNVER